MDNDTPFFSPGKIMALIAGSIALTFALFGVGGLVETNQAGYYKILQVPVSGNMKVFSNPGMFVQMFGNVWEYKVAGTYRFSSDEDNNSDSTVSPPVEVRFSDAAQILMQLLTVKTAKDLSLDTSTK